MGASNLFSATSRSGPLVLLLCYLQQTKEPLAALGWLKSTSAADFSAKTFT